MRLQNHETRPPLLATPRRSLARPRLAESPPSPLPTSAHAPPRRRGPQRRASTSATARRRSRDERGTRAATRGRSVVRARRRCSRWPGRSRAAELGQRVAASDGCQVGAGCISEPAAAGLRSGSRLKPSSFGIPEKSASRGFFASRQLAVCSHKDSGSESLSREMLPGRHRHAFRQRIGVRKPPRRPAGLPSSAERGIRGRWDEALPTIDVVIYS